MRYIKVPSSEGRKNLPRLIKEVEETGEIVVFTVHGKSKVAMVDFDLLEEFVENIEFGITAKELLEREKEETFDIEELTK